MQLRVDHRQVEDPGLGQRFKDLSTYTLPEVPPTSWKST